jgi:hypothetical protein
MKTQNAQMSETKGRVAAVGLAMLLAIAVVLSSCASGRSGSAYPDESYSVRAEEARVGATPGVAPEGGAPQAAPASEAASDAAARSAADVLASTGAVGEGSEGTSPTQERLRVYSASLALTVGRIEESRRKVMILAEEAGGYVESSHKETIVIRVPAKEFSQVLSKVEQLGTVDAKSIRTTDVTDQYADLTRRLEIAESSRDRLHELLERAEDAEERVAILREIRRLSEEIETLRASISSLGRLVEFSRISVRFTSRLSDRAVPRGIPFPWIAELDPIRATVGEASVALDVDLGASYAVFESGREVIAESADGARIRLGATANEPRGDTEFWAEALAHHLAPRYVHSRLEAGRFQGVRLESRGADSYVYGVLVAVRDEEIIVGEVFVPSTQGAVEHVEALLSALREVEL